MTHARIRSAANTYGSDTTKGRRAPFIDSRTDSQIAVVPLLRQEHGDNWKIVGELLDTILRIR